jgi:hypothetical protein
MPCPTVIFAPNSRQAKALAECLGCPALVSGDETQAVLRKFLRGGTLLIVADIQSMAIGWRAPESTAIAFLDGCGHAALRDQAEARIYRPGLGGLVIK